MKISSGSLQECLNTKLLLELQIFKATRIRIWFVAISVLAKILQVNTKSKAKEKDKETFQYSLFSLLSGAIFSHSLSIGLVLNRLLWPHQLSMKLTIFLLLKNTIDFLFFCHINSMDSRKFFNVSCKKVRSLLQESYNHGKDT